MATEETTLEKALQNFSHHRFLFDLFLKYECHFFVLFLFCFHILINTTHTFSFFFSRVIPPPLCLSSFTLQGIFLLICAKESSSVKQVFFSENIIFFTRETTWNSVLSFLIQKKTFVCSLCFKLYLTKNMIVYLLFLLYSLQILILGLSKSILQDYCFWMSVHREYFME